MINTVVGGTLMVLGVLCVLVAAAIAVREFVWPGGRKTFLAEAPVKIIELFLELLKAIAKAPPAVAFLVSGLLLIGGGSWILSSKPF